MAWNPKQTRDRRSLYLTDREKKQIEERFKPLTPDQFRADGVFEGGGVLGLAFLGALRCCAEIGLRWCDLAGTSAGAITAALLAADYDIDELDDLFGSLEYRQFASTKTDPLILTGDPSDDIEGDLPRLLFGLWATSQKGEYTVKAFHDWMMQNLAKKNIRSFNDLRGHKLKVVASDISRGIMLVLPDSLAFDPYKAAVGAQSDADNSSHAQAAAKDYSVADAVRMSMSIPLFFEPGNLADCTIVDGGITSNFPLWIYDEPPGKAPSYPTFGFRLYDKEMVPTMRNVVDVLKGVLKTMRSAHDRFYLQTKEYNRVINIDLTGVPVSVTKFGLTDEDKDELYFRGYDCARKFFTTQWNWAEHLAVRGFRPDGSPIIRESSETRS